MLSTLKTSPHLRSDNRVQRVMRDLLIALLPGVLIYAALVGWVVTFNLLLATATALLCEAAMLWIRQRPILPALSDLSAVVTAWLLALAITPLAPWWMIVLGVAFAIVVVKQLYGGLGYNLFNPAMAAYAMLLISFPQLMTQWPLPGGDAVSSLGFSGAWAVFTGALPDAITSATPLDHVKTQLGLQQPLSAITHGPLFGQLAGHGWEWINLGWLIGGLWLIHRRIINWVIPGTVLATLGGISLLFYFVDSEQFASPLFHLLSGGALLGAFFIATDPVTAATTKNGRIAFAAGIGLLIYVIRTWGGYPDGVAFAVLMMNLAAPAIDYYYRPSPFGRPQ